MMYGATTNLLACLISAMMLIVPGTIGVWIASPTEVGTEDLTELVELTEGCHLRCESRRSVALKDAGAASRRRADVVVTVACCRNLRQVSECCISGRLPGAKALAPLLL